VTPPEQQRGGLVRNYLDGTIGRRLFVKRLVATGITLASAAAYADVLAPQTARASARRAITAPGRVVAPGPYGFYHFYMWVTDNAFAHPNLTMERRGDSVTWGFVGANDHTVTDASGIGYFDSGYGQQLRNQFKMVFPAAGTFPYHCKDPNHSTTMKGVVKVPVGRNPATGPLGTTFEIIWAQKAADPGYVFDVQMQPPGGTFGDFRTGVTGYHASFKPGHKGEYHFRGRVRNKATGHASGYSPPASVEVR